eukprot:11803508-Alexandrium_andersonii.AAC.1
MSASLVGSEMCIRDSTCTLIRVPPGNSPQPRAATASQVRGREQVGECTCLLYTSDAADDM